MDLYTKIDGSKAFQAKKSTMKIKISGEASSEGVVWWRTRATCHQRVTVSNERHPLESPSFQDLGGINT